MRSALEPALAQASTPDSTKSSRDAAPNAPILTTLQKQVPIASFDRFVQRGLRPDPTQEAPTTEDLSEAYEGFQSAAQAASVLSDRLDTILARAMADSDVAAAGECRRDHDDEEGAEVVQTLGPRLAELTLLMAAVSDACRSECSLLRAMQGDVGPDTTPERLEAYEGVLRVRPFFDPGMVRALSEGVAAWRKACAARVALAEPEPWPEPVPAAGHGST